MTEEIKSDAEKLAEEHIFRYALSQVCEPGKEYGPIENTHNLLMAALKCGCHSCVGAYFSWMDWLCGYDTEWADKIAYSQGVTRYKTRKPDKNPFAGGWYDRT